jgi:hypothetical protein
MPHQQSMNEKMPSPSGDNKVFLGCGAIGCALLVVVPLILLGTAWFILFHTAIPFNWFAKILSNDEQIEIGKISGSISKGFRIEKIKFWETPEEVSVLEDIRILYPNLLEGLNKNRIDIEEIGIARAQIFLSTWNQTENADPTFDTDIHTGMDSSQDSDTESDGSIEHFRIGKIDINKVEILDPSQNFEFRLEELNCEGFETKQKRVSMGKLVIHSNLLDFSMSPVDVQDGVKGSNLKIDAKLQPSPAIKVIKGITLTGNLDLTDTENPIGKIESFDGKFHLAFNGKHGDMALSIDNLTLADYLDLDILLPNHLTWDATIQQNNKKAPNRPHSESGSFSFGKTHFIIQPGTTGDPTQILIATHDLKGKTYKCTLVDNGDNGSPYFQFFSVQKPKRPGREILAELQFRKPFIDLNPEAKEQVLKTLGENGN